MADRKPLKQRDPLDPSVGLATFEDTDTVGIPHGGTGADNAADARTNLDVYSKSESDGNPPAAHTHTESEVTDLDKYTQAEVNAALLLKKDDFTENTGFNKDLGTTAGTVAEGNHVHAADAVTYVDTHSIGATETQTAIDTLAVISGAGIISISATITVGAGNSTVNGDLDATDFTGHDSAVGTALQLEPNYIVTFVYGAELYRWTGPNDALVGLGGTYAALTGDLFSLGSSDHNALTNRNIADQHSIAAVTGLQTELNDKEPTISPKNSAFNKDFGTTTGTVTEGDDIRLSDSRPPTAHTHVEAEVTDLDKYTQLEVDNKDVFIQNQVTTNATDIFDNTSDISDNASDINDNAVAITTKEPIISPKNSAFNKNFGAVTGTVTEGDDARLSDSRPPTSHTHVEAEVTDLDKYTQAEVDAALLLKKDDFTENLAFNKDFGAIANTVTEGNDTRLSDARPPTAHTHTESEVT
ncbi:MAG: hypothetical protein DRQ39_08505, partial [Gammaproteobacteria bacterium]